MCCLSQIAKEWGQFGVRCNAIAFGWIETRLTQDKNKGKSSRALSSAVVDTMWCGACTGAFMQVGDKKIALGIPGADTVRAISLHFPLFASVSPCSTRHYLL